MGYFDVGIVGAGPAGGAAALALAREGMKVVILNREKFPRRKVCGSCLNTACWDLWKELDLMEEITSLPHLSLKQLTLEWSSAFKVSTSIHHLENEEWALDRSYLDECLIKKAVQAGAQFLESCEMETMNWEATDEVWKINSNHGTLQCRFIIGADGRNSRVARMTGLMNGPKPCHRVGWQTVVPFVETSNALYMRFFPEGYFGMVGLGDGRANIAMVLDRRCRLDPDSILKREMALPLSTDWKSIAPIERGDNKPFGNRVLLTGDALRVMEPVTGEGIYFALKTGLAAAQAVLEAQRETWHLASSRYHVAIKKMYHQRMCFNQVVRYFCVKPWLMRIFIQQLQRREDWLAFLTLPVLGK